MGRAEVRTSMNALRLIGFLSALTAVACTGTIETSTGSGAGTSTSSTGGHGSGGSGGAGGQQDGPCTAESGCADGEICTFGADSCAPGTKGHCEEGFSCDGPPEGPVCQCNGEVLEGENAACTLLGMSQPSADASLCAKGTFACGSITCTRNVEVCVIHEGGPQGTMPSYACMTPQAIGGTCANGIADCSCLDAS